MSGFKTDSDAEVISEYSGIPKPFILLWFEREESTRALIVSSIIAKSAVDEMIKPHR